MAVCGDIEMSKTGCRVSLCADGHRLIGYGSCRAASTFQRLFPSSPSGTPRPYPDLDSEREVKPRLPQNSATKQEPSSLHIPDGLDMEAGTSAGGDEERLERLGELEGLPESVSPCRLTLVQSHATMGGIERLLGLGS